jgi:hypothetical protein
MSYSTLVEFELKRACILVSKDHKQRWVTLDGVIHESPVPFRDALSVYWMPIVRAIAYSYRDRALANSAIGAL